MSFRYPDDLRLRVDTVKRRSRRGICGTSQLPVIGETSQGSTP